MKNPGNVSIAGMLRRLKFAFAGHRALPTRMDARRHPHWPDHVLVSVEDAYGPVSGLEVMLAGAPFSGAPGPAQHSASFRVWAWTSSTPPPGPWHPVEMLVASVEHVGDPESGFYDLGLYFTGPGLVESTPGELGVSTYMVRVQHGVAGTWHVGQAIAP